MRDFSLSRSLFQTRDDATIEETLLQSLKDPDRQSAAVAMLRGMLGKNSPLYLYGELHIAPLTPERIEGYRRIALKLLCEHQAFLLRMLPEFIARSQYEAAKDLYFSLAKYLPECKLQPQTPLILMLLSLYLADFGDLQQLCCQASCRYGFALLFRTLYPACRCQSDPFELEIAEANPCEPDWEALRQKIRKSEPYDEETLKSLLNDWPPKVAHAVTQKLQKAYETSDQLNRIHPADDPSGAVTQTITRSETVTIKGSPH